MTLKESLTFQEEIILHAVDFIIKVMYKDTLFIDNKESSGGCVYASCSYLFI